MIDFKKAERLAKDIVVSPKLGDQDLVNLGLAYLALSKQGLDDYHRGYEEGKVAAEAAVKKVIERYGR